MYLKALSSILLFLLIQNNVLTAQDCDSLQSTITVTIHTDDFGYETAWSLQDINGEAIAGQKFNSLGNNQVYTTTVCVAPNTCLSFIIQDAFNDGIFAPGFYSIQLNGEEIIRGDEFAEAQYHQINCTEGQTCETPIPIEEGLYTAPVPNTWYVFTPDTLGTFLINTCGAVCDTRIWVYSDCNINAVNEGNAGTLYFNDNAPDCDLNAVINANFQVGRSYYIRIGDTEESCATTPITWELSYEGPIVGCTDPSSCNFNPFASIDDDSCIPQDSPECPEGADLTIREDILRNTIRLDVVDNTDNCLINERCLGGYGLRNVLRFETYIENIGEMDYVIGPENNTSGQFSYDNCHQHYHYEGYAEYALYDASLTPLPNSFKNGFCVLDLECNNGGALKYSCEYMGISAGCEDIYDAELDCQWIDITDLPAGFYTFVTRINWLNRPDYFDRVEKNIANNFAQVCFNISYSNGIQVVEINDDCVPYEDCMGVINGPAVVDCQGVCGGTALQGDLDSNGLVDETDIEEYLLQLMDQVIAQPCYDLNNDDQITVYDAALLNDCVKFGDRHNHIDGAAHDHCNFPAGISNNQQIASLQILDFDLNAGYIDIGINNPNSQVIAYQFEMSGIHIASVTNLVESDNFTPTLRTDRNSGLIVGIAMDGSSIDKSTSTQPLLRIEVASYIDEQICLAEVINIVNHQYELIAHTKDNRCIVRETSGVDSHREVSSVQVQPNPFGGHVNLSFSEEVLTPFSLDILDNMGHLINTYSNIRNRHLKINMNPYASGLYYYRLRNETITEVKQLGIKK